MSLDAYWKACRCCQSEAEGRWGLGAGPQKNFLGPRPLERRKLPFWNVGEHCCYLLSLCSEGELIP